MKVNLQKDFDCLGWGYLRLVLHKIGIQVGSAEWIMAYVSNVHYAVVINGYPSDLFMAGKGLRQGFSLSPLLFILAMDGPSLHIQKVVAKGKFQALHMGRDIYISHSFFVDDILIMGIIKSFARLHLFNIFAKLGNASGFLMNL